MLIVTDKITAKGYSNFEAQRKNLPTKPMAGKCHLIKTTPQAKPKGNKRLAKQLGIACGGTCHKGRCTGPSIIIIDDGDFEYFTVECNCEEVKA